MFFFILDSINNILGNNFDYHILIGWNSATLYFVLLCATIIRCGKFYCNLLLILFNF